MIFFLLIRLTFALIAADPVSLQVRDGRTHSAAVRVCDGGGVVFHRIDARVELRRAGKSLGLSETICSAARPLVSTSLVGLAAVVSGYGSLAVLCNADDQAIHVPSRMTAKADFVR